MRTKFWALVFGLGVVGGYGSELFCGSHCSQGRRARFEQHIADVCVNAARNGEGPAAREAREAQDAWRIDRRGGHGHMKRGGDWERRGDPAPEPYGDPPPPAPPPR